MKPAHSLLALGVPAHLWSQAMLARVMDVQDPLGLARVKVELYALDTDADVGIWARVAAPFAGGQRGAFFLPQPGDEVLVVFAGGDSRAPVIIGGLWNGTDTPPETVNGQVDRWTITGKAGTKIAIIEETEATAQVHCQTPGGATFTLSDEGGGKLSVVCAGHTLSIEPAGTTLQSPATVKIQATQIEITAAMVKVNAAMSQFSGVVQCDTLIATSVVGTSYTPGAGNIW